MSLHYHIVAVQWKTCISSFYVFDVLLCAACSHSSPAANVMSIYLTKKKKKNLLWGQSFAVKVMYVHKLYVWQWYIFFVAVDL